MHPIKKEWKDFFKTVGFSLNPIKYEKLSERKKRLAFHYVLSVVLVSFIIMCLLFLPALLKLPGFLSNEFSKFDEFSINGTVSLREPIVIVEKRPFVEIKEQGNESDLRGKMLITKTDLYFKPFFKTKHVNLKEYQDLTSKTPEIASLMIFLAVLALPAVLVISYFLFVVKYLIIILIGAVLAFMIARIARHYIKFIDVLKVAMYGSTLMIILDMLRIPFWTNLYYIQYLAFAFYLFMGVKGLGHKEGEKKRRRGAEYIPLEDI